MIWTTSSHENNIKNDESNDSNYFNKRNGKFDFCTASKNKKISEKKSNKKSRDPYSNIVHWLITKPVAANSSEVVISQPIAKPKFGSS